MTSIYQDIAQRTGGDIYLGVVGPVRTGKSTFIKRFLEQLVIPRIDDPYRQARARDELPQSGSGRMIMTSEPKFIPEEAVTISPDDGVQVNVRLIDSVGYLIPGVSGQEEDGTPRMVTTPWLDHEIPMAQAAQLGTRKVMADHCTAGVLVTTDGSVTGFDRADYVQAEQQAIEDMRATGKPFVVVVNSADPAGEQAQRICQELTRQYQVNCLSLDCQAMETRQINTLLQTLLYAFPVQELQFYLPGWLEALEPEHSLKAALYEAMRRAAAQINQISQAEPSLAELGDLEPVRACRIRQIDLGQGIVSCELQFPRELFYQVLGEHSGFQVHSDADLLALLAELARIKTAYDQVAAALEQVQATGYGVVMPVRAQMQLTPPQVVKKGGSYAVKINATAPSIQMLRADIQAEITPMVGDEKQAQDLMQYLLADCDGQPEQLWQSNIFGRSVYDLVNENFSAKLHRMPDQARQKFKTALTRMVNEGSGGMICILL